MIRHAFKLATQRLTTWEIIGWNRLIIRFLSYHYNFAYNFDWIISKNFTSSPSLVSSATLATVLFPFTNRLDIRDRKLREYNIDFLIISLSKKYLNININFQMIGCVLKWLGICNFINRIITWKTRPSLCPDQEAGSRRWATPSKEERSWKSDHHPPCSQPDQEFRRIKRKSHVGSFSFSPAHFVLKCQNGSSCSSLPATHLCFSSTFLHIPPLWSVYWLVWSWSESCRMNLSSQYNHSRQFHPSSSKRDFQASWWPC